MESETMYQLQANMRRLTSWGDFFLGFEWIDSHSRPDQNSYHRQVIQCGMHVLY